MDKKNGGYQRYFGNSKEKQLFSKWKEIISEIDGLEEEKAKIEKELEELGITNDRLVFWLNEETGEQEEDADAKEVQETGEQPTGAVLIVDDIKMTRMILRRVLESEGYEVIEAERATQALDLLKDEVVELIISDISMPGMDGLQMVQRIRSNPKTADLPVVMCTVSKRKTDISHAVELGVKGFLVKPVAKEALLAKVAEILERKQSGAKSRAPQGAPEESELTLVKLHTDGNSIS